MTTSAAIILAGGQSRRMGTDKAALVVNGMSMLDRVRGIVLEAGVDEIVTSGPGGIPDADSDAGEGPMAGIAAGWLHLQSSMDPHPETVVVLSCDLVRLTSDLVRALVVASTNYAHGAVAVADGHRQPLIAAYRPVALDETAAAFRDGERSLRRKLAQWDVGQVETDPETVADADRPADLADFAVEWPIRPIGPEPH
jgi:molybdopterin-guanine dinucleotide biosynthesis protein A